MGVTVGGYVTARLAHVIPAKVLRIAIIAYGMAMIAWVLWTL